MRIVLVKSAAAQCAGACPEWISAEGTITPETGAIFRKVLKSIGNRKVPVFINSPGGSVEAALAIGRMLRAHHLDISITQTKFEGCAPTDNACGNVRGFKGYLGTPSSDRAICASACAFLIAGGERRFISWTSYVGIHEITTVEQRVSRQYKVFMKEENGQKVEVSRTLVSENKSAPFFVKNATALQTAREKVAQYYRDMGISDKLLDLAFETKAANIHWMTRGELFETHLLTDAVGGETLVGFAAKPMPVPVMSGFAKSVIPDSAYKAISPVSPPASISPDPTVSLPISPVGPTELGPFQEAIKTSPESPAQPAAPNPPGTPLADTFETSELGDVPLDSRFDIELLFSHRQSESQVNWSAMIRKGGLSQPAAHLVVRLEFGSGRSILATPSVSDSALSLKLHGEMPLRDYCDLARSADVRIRLTAPKPDGTPDDVVTEPKGVLMHELPWISCTAAKAASAEPVAR